MYSKAADCIVEFQNECLGLEFDSKKNCLHCCMSTSLETLYLKLTFIEVRSKISGNATFTLKSYDRLYF